MIKLCETETQIRPEDLPLPTIEKLLEIDACLENLINALTDHALWEGPGLDNVHPTLYHVWDFVNRSRYKLSEFGNIQQGRPVELPEQFNPTTKLLARTNLVETLMKTPAHPGTGNQAALKLFQDVCGRTMVVRLLITDKTGNAAVMTGAQPPTIDFGDECKRRLEDLEKCLPEGQMAAGVMASSLPQCLSDTSRQSAQASSSLDRKA
ncbi:hypothetical protein PVAG01_06938 [Phlyctema vagabunda]|uniref:Uncharacterized protein n=1 Tax=Phlyctema vagabunda TaxID=108571 RepID=A0ABR4PB10_9HELO